jgi:hypothetical protein
VNKQRAQWITLLAAALGMYVAGSALVGEVARLVDVVALGGASMLFGATLVQRIQDARRKIR